MTETRFEDKLNKFRQLLISGKLYSNISGKNEETLAMISVYKRRYNKMSPEQAKARLLEIRLDNLVAAHKGK